MATTLYRSIPFRVTVASGMLALGAALVGCSNPPPPKEPTPPQTADADIPNKNPNAGNIQLGPKLAKLCDMPTAYFAFDSANLSSEANSAFDVLAKCFTEGNAKGKRMTLTGHADPRGEIEYNFGLGQRRAGSVETLLLSRSVHGDQFATSSRGEQDATGTDEASWSRDRKLEIELAE